MTTTETKCVETIDELLKLDWAVPNDKLPTKWKVESSENWDDFENDDFYDLVEAFEAHNDIILDGEALKEYRNTAVDYYTY